MSSSPSPSAPSVPQPRVPPAGAGGIRTVMLDADGVLQLIGTPWAKALTQGGGPEFARALLAEEEDALCGRETLTDLLGRLVERLGLSTTAGDLLELWYRARPDPAAWQLVAELRAAGYTTVLATNQQLERRRWMRETLGYADLVDVEGYSCCLEVAKPSPAYFLRLLELTSTEPGQALFVDDNADNVAAARVLGIRTVHHLADSGGRLLRQEVVAAVSAASSASARA